LRLAFRIVDQKNKAFGEALNREDKAMFGLGTTELLIIGGIILLIFGARRLPEIGKGLGGAIKEFRKVKKDITTKDAKESSNEKHKEETSIENTLAEKVAKEVPVVKKGLAIKKKAENITKIIK